MITMPWSFVCVVMMHLQACTFLLARNFAYQKNLIRSELYANRPTAKFIPVYMDFLSDLDVPCFLRNKKSFSLPTQLTELVLYIIGEPVCKPVSVCPMLSLEEDSSLMKHKKIMEAKIRDLNGKHQKKFKNKNNNTFAKVHTMYKCFNVADTCTNHTFYISIN
jgi:hypothetical protein